MTLMVFVVLAILSTFILNFMMTENKQSLNHQYKTQAYYIARGAAETVEAAIFSDINEENIEEKIYDKLLQKLKTLENANVESPEIIINLDGIDIDGSKTTLTIEKEDGNLIIISRTIVSGIENKVEKILSFKGATGGGDVGDENILENFLDTPIYANDNLIIEGKPNFKGDKIVVGVGVLNEENIKKLKGMDTKEENREYPLINFSDKIEDIMNEILYKSNIKKLNDSIINKSTIFTNDEVEFKNVTIDASKGDIDIIINKELIIKDRLNIIGTGKVRILVIEKIEFDEDLISINKNGNSNQLEIVYGGEENFKIEENPHIWANFFINKAEEVEIEGNPHIYGNFFINKAEKVKIEGNPHINGLIYAPNSKIEWEKNGSVYGIIGKKLEIEGNPNIYSPTINSISSIPVWVKKIIVKGSGTADDNGSGHSSSYYR